MKLETERKDIYRALGLAMLASGRNCKDAALQNVLVRVSSGQATVESFDTHIYSRAVFPASGEQGDEFAVEGDKLSNLVSVVDDGKVDFTSGPDGLRVVFGKASINLRTFPIDKYVRMQVKEEKKIATNVRAGVLLAALEFSRPFIGKDTANPNRMLAELRNGRMLSGDGARIGVVTLNDFNFNIKFPNAVVSGVTRWLKDQVEGQEESLIDVSESEEFYLFSTPSGAIFGWRKPEHDFIDIEKYLGVLEADDTTAFKFKIDKESLQKLVTSLSVVLEAGAERIEFSSNGNPMQPFLIGKATDSRNVASSNQSQIVVDTNGETNEFAIRFNHLGDTLKLMKNPVVVCDVRKKSSIMKIQEQLPEMSTTAYLTLMSEV